MRASNGFFMIGVGAALMYFFDPQNGRHRRALAKDRYALAVRKVDESRRLVMRDTPRSSGNKITGALGAGLAAFGLFRGGIRGLALGALGSGLMVGAATNRDLKTVRIRKEITIAAPPERVFEYWANFENFPQWMSHVRSVHDEGNNRYHWVVDGPAGVPIQWHSELHDVIENRQMGWRSLPDSMVDHSGMVQFEDDGAGGTRVQVDLSYTPTAGLFGHAVARAFGTDPKSEMDTDLQRFKSCIEGGHLVDDPSAPLEISGDEDLSAPPPGAQRH